MLFYIISVDCSQDKEYLISVPFSLSALLFFSAKYFGLHSFFSKSCSVIPCCMKHLGKRISKGVVTSLKHLEAKLLLWVCLCRQDKQVRPLLLTSGPVFLYTVPQGFMSNIWTINDWLFKKIPDQMELMQLHMASPIQGDILPGEECSFLMVACGIYMLIFSNIGSWYFSSFTLHSHFRNWIALWRIVCLGRLKKQEIFLKINFPKYTRFWYINLGLAKPCCFSIMQ